MRCTVPRIFHSLISRVTETVVEEINVWQNRPLGAVCPVHYLAGITVKIHHEKVVITKMFYLALDINAAGHKELLGLC